MIEKYLRKKRKQMRMAASRSDPLEHSTDLFAIAPPTNHSLDPATTPFDVAKMAGFGADGYDSAQGVDRMVTGDVDARRELEVESSTPGSPIDLGPNESILGGSDQTDFDSDREFDYRRWL